ncbi:dolichyl-diphosphooligosaccharide--protein glycotransferase subunit OST1 KNAG_0H02470 [Huiozyma naganishii CBS 8797]|uniref:Dolichyl-diphosphooligosaccharide--protein glycosyltransferase subunit 1 n=1 Tax=Huiozyma naganishii (strain ATCC MYA-139 / BCRC 22969 / CBS 8797 / KCTC 17520 / NBRC 10181 / NCYC 3082 / Yp74L-3) TaxID=1071383 RepID=J7S1V1_HUIN7|nr:hypothetical protein KNAG_0H02470 [Kazachstania naganishii CBS 8797]CCK71662.1 hypothetical protein KNAG_0H02470 [Kazachstania naganishii CBS 8797]
MRLPLSWALSTLLVFCQLVVSITPEGWENVQFDRIVDVRSTYTVETYELTAKNTGSEATTQYYLALPERVFQNLSMFTAALHGVDAFLNCYVYDGETQLDDGVRLSYGIIELPSPVAPGKEVQIAAKVFYNEAGLPYPEHIPLNGDQQLRFQTQRQPLSPYFTEKSSLQVISNTPVSEYDAKTDTLQELNKEGNAFVVDQWENVSPFKVDELDMVYKHNLPLKEVINLQRDIWVSHWASTVQFQEYYEMTNKGAKLDKGFSRLEYMKASQNQMTQLGMTPFASLLEMNLPDESTEQFFTDKVGMVSTYEKLGSSLFLRPRFPIFGGWFYNFTIGWTNPLENFVSSYPDDNEVFLLNVPLLNGPKDTVYDHASISIFLPENAELLDTGVPIPLETVSVDTEFSYFDFGTGHTKVTFQFKNLFTDMNKAEILVKYRFTKNSLFRKPITIAGYFFALLMSFFVLKSINLKVTSEN